MKTLITGIDSGLGRELFRRFLEDHSNTYGTSVCIDRPKEKSIPMWVRPGLTVEASLEKFEDHFRFVVGDDLDILINNVGINSIIPFDRLTEANMIEMMRVNYILPVIVVQTLLPYFSYGARILNVVSESAHRPMRHSLAYCCSKAATAMASRVMAKELSKTKNLSIVSVNPGKILYTSMTSKIDEQVQEAWKITEQELRVQQAEKRIGVDAHAPDKLANLIYDLVTSDLFHSMSGATMDLVG